jgi:hypothetical protein
MSTAVCLDKSISFDAEIKPRESGSRLELPVFVLFTSIKMTLKALEKAVQLARSRRTGITILALRTVPFPLPLDEPPVPFEFVIRRFEKLAEPFPEKTRISAYLCRDPMEALKRLLIRNCQVVMGVRKNLWPNRDQRLARGLRRSGYDVISVETE